MMMTVGSFSSCCRGCRVDGAYEQCRAVQHCEDDPKPHNHVAWQNSLLNLKRALARVVHHLYKHMYIYIHAHGYLPQEEVRVEGVENKKL